jgi:hypothetical protein
MTALIITPHRKWQAAVLAVLEAASKLLGLTVRRTGIAAPGETGLQPEEAKALEVYAAIGSLRYTLPAEADEPEWLTPEQTEIVWENLEYRR